MNCGCFSVGSKLRTGPVRTSLDSQSPALDIPRRGTGLLVIVVDCAAVSSMWLAVLAGSRVMDSPMPCCSEGYQRFVNVLVKMNADERKVSLCGCCEYLHTVCMNLLW